MESQNYRVTEL